MMAVPEATVDEDHLAQSRENKIRTSEQFSTMKKGYDTKDFVQEIARVAARGAAKWPPDANLVEMVEAD